MPNGRLLDCTRCHGLVRVYEAAQGATSDDDHQHLDEHSFICGGCLETITDARQAAVDERELALTTGHGIPY